MDAIDASAQVDRIAEEARESIPKVHDLLAKIRLEFEEKDREIAKRDERIAGLEERVATLDSENRELQNRIVERDAQIKKLENELGSAKLALRDAEDTARGLEIDD